MLIFFLGTECFIDNVLDQKRKGMNNIHMTYFSIQNFTSTTTFIRLILHSKFSLWRLPIIRLIQYLGKCEKVNVSDTNKKNVYNLI